MNRSVRPLGWTIAALLALALGSGLYALMNGRASAPPFAAAPDAVQQALRGGKPTVVEFGANACAACREMKPILAHLAREHGERIAVVDIDLIKESRYIKPYRIQLMPTQVFYDAHGREIGRNLGTISERDILARLEGATP